MLISLRRTARRIICAPVWSNLNNEPTHPLRMFIGGGGAVVRGTCTSRNVGVFSGLEVRIEGGLGIRHYEGFQQVGSLKRRITIRSRVSMRSSGYGNPKQGMGKWKLRNLR